MTEEAAQRIKDANARLDLVESRSRFVDEALSAMEREGTRAPRVEDEDGLDQAEENLVHAQALHAGFGKVLMNAGTAFHEAIDAADLTPEEREYYIPLLNV